jgi:hypothetical protein
MIYSAFFSPSPHHHNCSLFAYLCRQEIIYVHNLSGEHTRSLFHHIISNSPRSLLGTMAWSTKKSITIIVITISVLCAVIVSTINSRDSQNKGSTRSAAGTERVLTDPTAMPSDVPSMVPSDTPSAVPSMSPSASFIQKRVLASDYPSSAPSDIPSNVPSSIPLSDYPSIVPSSWGTAEPTAQYEQFATKNDKEHKRQVRALRQQEKAMRQQGKA